MTDYLRHLNGCSTPPSVEHSFLPETVAGLREIAAAAAWRFKITLQHGVRTVTVQTPAGSWEVCAPGSFDLRIMVAAAFEGAAERQSGARA